MQGDGLFWGIAAAGLALCLAVIFMPLWRGAVRADRRASYDMQVHRDQLREIDADLARGVLSPAEAEASRIEVSRRLIAAADAEAAEAGAGAAPRRLTRWAAVLLAAVVVVGALALYGRLGAPGLPDQPLDVRLAEAAAERAARPKQAEAERLVAARTAGQGAATPSASDGDAALIARLQDVLKARPDDLRGWRLLASSLGSLERWPEARAAEERVVALLGDTVTADDLVDLAEAQILAAGGYVSPEAEAALGRALTLEPKNPVARYYSALTLLQGGRPDLAYRMWQGLVTEGPADAPWMAPARAGLAEAAREAGIAVPPEAGGAAPRGPTAEDAKAAEGLAPDDRQAMIEAMVAKLSDRLASQGGPPQDWAQLIRSLGVLGRRDQAAAVLGEARTIFASDAAGTALIERAAKDAGLPPAPAP